MQPPGVGKLSYGSTLPATGLTREPGAQRRCLRQRGMRWESETKDPSVRRGEAAVRGMRRRTR